MLINSLTSQNAQRTLGYYAGYVFIGIITAALGPALPDLARHTASDLAQVSVLFTTRSVGYMLGSLQAGRLYEYVPGHKLMFFVLLGLAGLLLAVPLAPVLWLLALLFFFLGVAQGTSDLGSNLMLVWTHGEKVGPFMNGLHFCFGVGAFLAPLILAQSILRSGDITAAYWLMAGLALPVAGWLVRLPTPTPPLASGANGQNTARPVHVPLVAFITLFFFFYVGVEAGFGSWAYTYAIQEFGGGLQGASAVNFTAQAAFLTSIFFGAIAVGRLTSAVLMRRISARGVILAGVAGCLLSLGFILLTSSSFLALQAGAAGLGFCLGPVYPTMMAYSGQNMPFTGRVTSLFLMGSGAGAMVLPWIIGQLIERFGAQITMPLIFGDLALLAVTLGVVLALVRRKLK